MNMKIRPSHKAYVVRKNGDKSYWTEIGAAWPHSDGEGLNLRLDMIPLGTTEIVIRKPRKAGEGGAP